MPQDPGTLFIEKIMAEAGLSELPADYKQQYIDKLQEQVNRRVGLIILDNLSEADSQEFAKTLNSSPAASMEEMRAFFADKIPSLEEKIKAGLAEFAAQFIARAKK